MRSVNAARALGLTGIGLGLAEMAVPARLGARLGLRDSRTMLRAMGAREILSGLGILSRRNPAPGLWARVAGDAIDLGLLAAAVRRSRDRRKVAWAIATVLAIGALDVYYVRRVRRANAAL